MQVIEIEHTKFCVKGKSIFVDKELYQCIKALRKECKTVVIHSYKVGEVAFGEPIHLSVPFEITGDVSGKYIKKPDSLHRV